MAYRDNIPFTIEEVAGSVLRMYFKRKTPTKITVNCPFCLGKKGQPDTEGHMTLSLDRDRFRCHRCGRSGGKINLYAEMMNVDTKTAYKEIMDSLGGASPQKSRKASVTAQQIPVPTIEADKLASVEQRHKTYSALLDMLTLTTLHIEDLKGRGLPAEIAHGLQYKSVPQSGHRKLATLLLQQGCQLEGVPGFYVDKDGHWKLNVWNTGIIMPCRDIDGKIQALQVRKDFVKKKKCYWITSVDKCKGIGCNTRAHFSNIRLDTDTFYLTEGIMKSDIAAYLSNRFFIALAGVSQYEALRAALKVVRERLPNIKYVAVAWDMDQMENSAVRESLDSIYKIVREAGLGVRKINWNPSYNGIDQFLASRSLPASG